MALDELSAARLAFGEKLRELNPEEFERELKTFGKMVKVTAPEGASTEALDLPTITPQEFDFDTAPDPPSYVVDKMIERATVNIFSGDTGAAKSITSSALVVAAAQASVKETSWLDHKVIGTRSLVIDEENPRRLVRARLGALGLDNEIRDCVRYFAREGVLIGADPWTEWLHGEARDHKADMIFIDTAMAATAADVNDNDDVVALYRKLRPIAEDLDCAIIILHHERKPQPGSHVGGGQNMLGARQWAGQADTHLEIRTYSELMEEDSKTAGNRRLEREFVFEKPKVRDGEPNIPHKIVVVSEKDEKNNRLLWMRVDDKGELDPSEEAKELAMLITNVIEKAGRGLSATTIAVEVKQDENSKRFKTALKITVENGTVVHNKSKGLYSFATEKGLAI